MRNLYTLLFYALLPLIILRLGWRSLKAPNYAKRWLERLGFYTTEACVTLIWFHTVSVGEAEAAFPLIKLLQNRYPDDRFLITSTTPTGSSRISNVLGNSVEHVYLPYDLPNVLNRFFKQFQPKAAVFLEKEIWPNAFAACRQRQIPLFIVNARLSARSAKSYQLISSLTRATLKNVTLIATQTEADKEQFIKIGNDIQQVQVLGNTKFDIKIANDLILEGQHLKQQLFANRFVIILGSSHPGEEILFLKLFPVLKSHIPNLLLLIVPRHPERFQTVKQLCLESKLSTVLRSERSKAGIEMDIYIADSIGELKMLYAAADIAIVGGSFVPIGGHNVLEPAAIGIPVLFGRYMFNSQETADQMLAQHCALQCLDESEILAAVLKLYADQAYRNALVENALRFVEKNQGTTQKLAALISTYLN